MGGFSGCYFFLYVSMKRGGQTNLPRQRLRDAPDAIVVHLLAPDTVGKEVGFSPTCKQYVEALEQTDARIGKLLPRPPPPNHPGRTLPAR